MAKLKSIKFPGLDNIYEIDTGITPDELDTAVDSALAKAKASGEFKGDTGAQGEKGDKGDKGDTGATGATGADGTSVTVTSVSESTEDGGSNIVRFSDGKAIVIRNGSKGSQGAKGDTGATGADGYTPVKGTDYWTATDKSEMVDDVLAALPTWTGGSY